VKGKQQQVTQAGLEMQQKDDKATESNMHPVCFTGCGGVMLHTLQNFRYYNGNLSSSIIIFDMQALLLPKCRDHL